MAARAITALFDDYDAAARAVDKLEAEGVAHGEISIVARDPAESPAAPGTVSKPAPEAESDA
ncbi:hypothetical protein ACFQ12_11615, partial [Methylobacterium trifolii]